MTTNGYCPSCGTPRGAGAFCANCGASFAGPGPTSTPVGSHQSMAAGLYDIETLRLKLIVGRLVGIAIGLGIWWVVLGPVFNGDFLPTFGSLIAVLFGGLYIGQMVTLSIVRGS